MVATETDVCATTMNPPLVLNNTIPIEALEVLHELASAWSDVADPAKAMEVVPMSWMATNRVFQVKWKTNTLQDGEVTYRKVLLRIYGEGGELFFNRKDEIRMFEAVSKQGKGPRLLGTFANGRVEEFINGWEGRGEQQWSLTGWQSAVVTENDRSRRLFPTLSAKDLRDPKKSAIIAAKLREFHDLNMPGPKKILLWDRLKYWLKLAKRLSSPEESKEFCLDKVEDEISSLENELSSENQRIGFCHNDLQHGNIMMDEEQLILIDYEYAGFNPVAFDIANHFCEMAADYYTATPHILDYNKYPDIDHRKRFVQIYLSSPGEDPKDVEVENLLQNIEKYVLASHWWNILWCIISIHVNDIGLDYIEYARQRFQQYWLRKPEILTDRRMAL